MDIVAPDLGREEKRNALDRALPAGVVITAGRAETTTSYRQLSATICDVFAAELDRWSVQKGTIVFLPPHNTRSTCLRSCS